MTAPHTLNRLENTRENANKVAEILVCAFADDPVINAFVEPIRDPVARLHFRQNTWFQVLILAATLNKCEMYEVDGWKGVSVWMPPNTDVGNPWTMIPAGLHRVLWGLGIRGVARMLGPGRTVMDPFKKQAGVKGKGSKGYWYCFFVGVLPEHQGQGLSLPLMSPHTPSTTSFHPLSPSHTPQHPTWLEATTPRSRAVYEKLGYQLVGEGRIAVGSVDGKGMTEKGGEGVPMWGMVIPGREKDGK
ncbi:hypothetical protein BCR35DRAFT_354980 [Leucosporidium creatinivorum]|uniref:N-acetyltransferase domain-containing protein n=1 Tax=Leucosporidium creatinivorum TaxID=106004 RepID=A0A1Y2DZB9_9BASI|nr:hypothetical protein BCR35DRAFT_354980 [Leucosporidium creatinivorum]